MFNTEFYYSDEYGTDQLLTQFNWLTEDLQKANIPENRHNQPWIIACGHRPMYCSATHGTDCYTNNSIRTGYKNKYYNLENLFYQYGVDIQIYGHTHDYERLYPVFNLTYQKLDNPSLLKDVIYPIHIVSGSAGNREKHPGFVHPKPDYSYFRRNDYGYAYIDVVDRLQLSIKQYSIRQHRFIDVFTVQKSQDYPNFSIQEIEN